MWSKSGNSGKSGKCGSISIPDAIITSILQGFYLKKKIILSGALGSSSIIWDWD